MAGVGGASSGASSSNSASSSKSSSNSNNTGSSNNSRSSNNADNGSNNSSQRSASSSKNGSSQSGMTGSERTQDSRSFGNAMAAAAAGREAGPPGIGAPPSSHNDNKSKNPNENDSKPARTAGPPGIGAPPDKSGDPGLTPDQSRALAESAAVMQGAVAEKPSIPDVTVQPVNPATQAEKTPEGSWYDGMATRAFGAAKTAFGLGEIAVGAVGMAAPEPVTTIGGAVLATHGVDTTVSGWNEMVSGEPTPTLTERAATNTARALGTSPGTAVAVGIGVDMAAGLGNPATAARHAGREAFEAFTRDAAPDITARRASDFGLPAATTPATLHTGKQGKHVPTDNNFNPGKGKSELTHPDPQGLLDRGAGLGQDVPGAVRGEPGFKETFDFGEGIGTHVDLNTGARQPTTRGTIHYDGNGGAHIVPARPQ